MGLGQHRADSPPSAAPALWISAGLVALTLAVFLQVRHFDFVAYDDPLYVTENPHIAQGLTATAVAWAFTTSYAANWHPLTWLSHMMDVQAFGLDAGSHHLTSVVLHAANSVLLFWLLRVMTGAIGRSAFVAALFAIHPLHVESVAWISERKDVLSTLFWLLTSWAYVAYVRRRRVGLYLVVIVLFTLGLMAKPMLVTLPFTLLLLDFWPLGRLKGGVGSWWPLVREKIPLFALAVVSSVVTLVAQQHGGAVSTIAQVSIASRVTNALASYVGYLEKTIWPVDLAGFYPLTLEVRSWSLVWAIVLVAGLSLAAVRLARQAPYLLVGWSWYIGTLVPVIGLVQVGVQAMADRYTYVPLIGVLVAGTWAAADVLGRRPHMRRWLPAAAILLILLSAVRAHAQVGQWKDSATFWTRAATVAFSINDFQAHLGIGRILSDQGRAAEAHEHFVKAVDLRPDDPAAQHLRGVSALGLDRIGEALAALEAAVRLQPGSSVMQNDLGWALVKAGRIKDALPRFAEAIRLRPGFAGAHNNMGLAYAVGGRLPDALPRFSEAVRLDPALEEARINLARTLAGLGRVDEARRELAEALQRNPSSSSARILLDQLSKSQRRP